MDRPSNLRSVIMQKRIAVLTAVFLAVGCGGSDSIQQSPRIEANQLGSFQPTVAKEAAPVWVRELGEEMKTLSAEGIAVAMPEHPAPDRAGWLVYEPKLSPPNWIVGDGANLPAPEGALRAYLAYLRMHRAGPFALGFTRDGRVVSEPSGEFVAHPASVTRAGPNVPVAFDIAGSGSWETANLPFVGSVRYQLAR